MEGLAPLLGSAVFVANILFSMLAGISVIYIIRYHPGHCNKKLLRYIFFMLASLIFAGIVFTYGFINPKQWSFYLKIAEGAFLAVFAIYFIKSLIIFPDIKHKKPIRAIMVFAVLINVLFIFARLLNAKNDFVIAAQSAFLLIGCGAFYIFTVSFLILLEQENNKKILCLEWKRQKRKK